MQKQQLNIKSKRFILVTIFEIYIIFILMFTIIGRFDNYQTVTKYNLHPFNTISSFFLYFKSYTIKEFVVNIIGNIVVLIPFGYLLPLIFCQRFNRFLPVLGVGFLFILFIESMQFLFQIGMFDVDDFILNLIGVAIGFWLVRKRG